MPVYKGTTEITSGKLYKGASNIENGYKQTASFYVNAIAATVNSTTNSRNNTDVTIRLTFTGGFTPNVSSYGYYQGTTTSANKITVATGQNIAPNGYVDFTISGLTFNSSYQYLFFADNGAEGTQLATFYTNNYIINNVNGGVGSGVGIPGNVNAYASSFPTAYTGAGSGGGTSYQGPGNGSVISSATWNVTSLGSAPSGSPSSGITGSAGNFSVTAAGTHTITWSGGSISSLGSGSASVGGSVGTISTGGLSQWASVGSITNNTSASQTFIAIFTGLSGSTGNTSIGASMSIGSSSGPNTPPQGNQSNFSSGNPSPTGTRTLAAGQSATVYFGTISSNSSSGSGQLQSIVRMNNVDVGLDRFNTSWSK